MRSHFPTRVNLGTVAATVNTAVGLALHNDHILLGSLAIAGCTLLIWWKPALVNFASNLSYPKASAALPALTGLVIFFALANPRPEIRPPSLGSTGEEKAGGYLAEHFPRSAQVGAPMPAVVWSAKLNWQPMVWDVCSGAGPEQGRFQRMEIETSDQLKAWIARTGVQAIYLDGLLKHFQPELYGLIEQHIGGVFVEIFAVQDTNFARQRHFSDLGIQIDGWHRILKVRPSQLDQSPLPSHEACPQLGLR